MKCIELFAEGKVQGVYFRAQTQNKAKELHICGYVENLRDGRVHIVAEGSGTDMVKFVAWCRKGPMLARVDKLTEQELAPVGFEDFVIRR